MLYIFLLGFVAPNSADQIYGEYCHTDEFNATCGPCDVILMTSAFYGRMRIGKCVPYDYEVGCSSDVLEEAESRCSGRESCSFSVSEVFKVRPCRIDLVAYLEASYTCLPVIQPVVRSQKQSSSLSSLSSSSSSSLSVFTQKCTNERAVEEIRARSGYLSAWSAFKTGHGTEACPWKLRASPGQRIQVTLFDFSGGDRYFRHSSRRIHRSPGSNEKQFYKFKRNSASSSSSNNLPSLRKASSFHSLPASSSSSSFFSVSTSEHSCWPVAVFQEFNIKENSQSKTNFLNMKRYELSSCTGGGPKEKRKVVFLSLWNVISVHLFSNSSLFTTERTSDALIHQTLNLLFHFEVIGCAEPELVGNVVLMRREDVLGVYCNTTGERWHIVCRNNSWVGSYSNCSQAVHSDQQSQNDEFYLHRRKMSLGLLVAVSVGVLVGIVSGFVLLVMIFTCRRRLRHHRAEQSVLLVDYDNKTNSYKVLDRSNVNIPLDPTSNCSCSAGFQTAPVKYSSSPVHLLNVDRRFPSRQLHSPDHVNYPNETFVDQSRNIHQVVQLPCDVVPQSDNFLDQLEQNSRTSEPRYFTASLPNTVNDRNTAFTKTFPVTCSFCFPAAALRRGRTLRKTISRLSCENSQVDEYSGNVPSCSQPDERWIILPCSADDASVVAATTATTTSIDDAPTMNNNNQHSAPNKNDRIVN